MAPRLCLATCLVCARVFCPARAAQDSAGLSLDDYLGFTNRDSLVGATVAGKDRIAWVEKQRGVVNLWAADERDDWTPRQLTHSTTDDGADGFDFLQFTPNGQTLVFVYGTVAAVNAKHLTRPPSAATYAVPFAGGNVTRLANESAVALTADGGSFLYVSSRGTVGGGVTLWQQELKPNVAPKELFSVKQGTLADFTWQPGGRLLAFSNDRGDHGYVGLFDPSSDALHWVAAGVDTDLQPAWSPNGSSLAWMRARLPPGNVGYSPFDGNMGNRGPDFSAFVAQVASDFPGALVTKGIREVFRDDKYGMLNFGYGERPLFWVNETAVVFGTEAVESWGHAVMIDVTSAAVSPRELRPGKCEDSSWTRGGDGWVYLVNNCAELDTVGVERVRLSDFFREPITTSGDAPRVSGLSGSGHGLVVLSRNVAFLGTTFNTPTNIYVSALDGGGLRGLTKNFGFASDAFVVPKTVEFPSPDGRFTLHAQLFLPNQSLTGAEHSRIPGVVYTHGGSERQMYPAFHFASCYAQEYAANQWLASRGVAVLSVNYRSGTGYGHDFRVCTDCMARGAAEYQDVRAAALQLASMSGIDSDRLGIWGLSYGGLNAEQACARDSSIFKACVAIAGMFNWVSASRYYTDTGRSVYDADVEPALPGGFRALPIGPEPAWAGPGWLGKVQKLQALLLDSSPAGHVENLTSPMLLIHGDADEEVDFQETIGAVRAVRALGRDNVKVLTFPDEAHGMAAYKHQLRSLQATGDFLMAHLFGGASAHAASLSEATTGYKILFI